MLMHAHNEPDGWDFPLGVTSQRYLIHFASPMSSQTGAPCGRPATSITYTAVIAAGLVTSMRRRIRRPCVESATC